MFSIIIPTRGSYHTLVQCLERIVDTVPTSQGEIIIVVNGDPIEQNLSRGCAEAVREEVSRLIPIRIFTSAEPGFTAAVNLGAEKARNEDLIFLNDDTLPGVGWLDRMFAKRASMQEQFPALRFGAVGPTSNYVLDTQSVAAILEGCQQPDNVDRAAAVLAKTPAFGGNRTATVLSGFCLLVAKKLWREVGGFRKIGPLGGCEDLDFGLRLRDAGYLNLVADDAFVYHHGSVTLNAKDPAGKGGTTYAPMLYKKWYRPQDPKKLCIFYRVRLTHPEDWAVFAASLQRGGQVADAVAVFDDQSTEWSDASSLQEAVRLVLPPDFPLLWQEKDPSLPFHEAADRNAALTLARSSGADWLFNLDHDEVLDEYATRETLQDLMHPLDPNTTAYTFPIRTLWRGVSKVRLDGIWGQMRLATLFRADASFGPILPMRDSPFHCSRSPALMPGDGIRISHRIIVWHYGYADYERQAKSKYAYYESRDTVKDPILIGAADYKHLVDESSLHLATRLRRRVALAVMCRNEFVQVAEIAARYQPFFDSILVQDNGSTDGTVVMCQTLGIPHITWRCCEQAEDPEHLLCDFAAARNHLLDAVRRTSQADYVFVLDPDERIQLRTLLLFDHIFATPADAYMGTIINYSNQRGMMERTNQPACRLFSLRNPLIAFRSRLHETVEESLREHRENLVVADASALCLVDHQGWLVHPEQRKKKDAVYATRLEEMLLEDPGDPKTLFGLGVHYLHECKPQDGKPLVEMALQLYPQFWKARQQLVELHMRDAVDLLTDIPKGGAPPLGSPESKYAGAICRALLQFFPDLQARARIDD